MISLSLYQEQTRFIGKGGGVMTINDKMINNNEKCMTNNQENVCSTFASKA